MTVVIEYLCNFMSIFMYPASKLAEYHRLLNGAYLLFFDCTDAIS